MRKLEIEDAAERLLSSLSATAGRTVGLLLGFAQGDEPPLVWQALPCGSGATDVERCVRDTVAPHLCGGLSIVGVFVVDSADVRADRDFPSSLVRSIDFLASSAASVRLACLGAGLTTVYKSGQSHKMQCRWHRTGGATPEPLTMRTSAMLGTGGTNVVRMWSDIEVDAAIPATPEPEQQSKALLEWTTGAFVETLRRAVPRIGRRAIVGVASSADVAQFLSEDDAPAVEVEFLAPGLPSAWGGGGGGGDSGGNSNSGTFVPEQQVMRLRGRMRCRASVLKGTAAGVAAQCLREDAARSLAARISAAFGAKHAAYASLPLPGRVFVTSRLGLSLSHHVSLDEGGRRLRLLLGDSAPTSSASPEKGWSAVSCVVAAPRKKRARGGEAKTGADRGKAAEEKQAAAKKKRVSEEMEEVEEDEEEDEDEDDDEAGSAAAKQSQAQRQKLAVALLSLGVLVIAIALALLMSNGGD